MEAQHDPESQAALGPQEALVELRRQLKAGRLKKRLSMNQMQTRSGLGRTVVSQAFSPSAPPPSAATVNALADALGLDTNHLLDLLYTATTVPPGPRPAPQPTPLSAIPDRPRPIRSWTAKRLGVHPAISGRPDRQVDSGFVLPAFVPRPHDEELRDRLAAAVAEQAPPALVVVRGPSCTGKTRTAFEAVQHAIPDDFQLLVPANASSLLMALAANALTPRTVLWLNEAQDYLAGAEGEAVAASLLRRLDSHGPLIVIATLWPEHDRMLSSKPADRGHNDPHRQTRMLLDQAHRIYVPHSFADDLDAARVVARKDGSLAAAIAPGITQLTQTLAAGPDLVEHYEHPAGEHGVYGKALITAAMDAYRLGVIGPLPMDFLEASAPGYLTDRERAAASGNWLEGALAYARALIKQVTAPLQDFPRPSGMGAQPGVVRLADYLQQYGRHTRWAVCPPSTFWDAATQHLTPDDRVALASAARVRHRYRHAAALYRAAADSGDSDAPLHHAWLLVGIGDRAGAEHLARQAVSMGNTSALVFLAQLREEDGDGEGAERLYRDAALSGHAERLQRLAELRQIDRDWEGIERLYRAAADAGDVWGLGRLAAQRGGAGKWEEAERLAQQAANGGGTWALTHLAWSREKAGHREEADRLYRAAIDAGDAQALGDLAWSREEAGHREEAERLALQAAEAGDVGRLLALADYRGLTGDWAGAERLALQAAEAGNVWGLLRLAEYREQAGDRADAERLAQQVADAGNPWALAHLAGCRQRAGDQEGAEQLYLAAADAGDTQALVHLIELREQAEDRDEAERLYRAAADTQDGRILLRLAEMREEAGHLEAAECLVQQAADTGRWASHRLFNDARVLARGHITRALLRLAESREHAGQQEEAERLVQQAIATGSASPLREAAKSREQAGDSKQAERLYLAAADAGDQQALREAAWSRKRAGDREGAERLYLAAADAGETWALEQLAACREEAGDWEGAERLYLAAADAGEPLVLHSLAQLLDKVTAEQLLRYGLEADGTVSKSWRQSRTEDRDDS
ncbi:hypothetical protein [Streptomyces sp. PAN_FS17]|uniref:hypothetical protein n=1 Tax=Streptomyces sp. PAN_FS17 TaxID=1855351 RepID=UPI00089A9A93|nr:hypothetical protein [Streptomyces sp. PAN_FS17]SEB60073.1 Tetratricopeptide repeat-containing protein [Streptomyces sp. PAN_FS17]